jgi:hypothetical protein
MSCIDAGGAGPEERQAVTRFDSRVPVRDETGRQVPGVKTSRNHRLGYAAARNTGAEAPVEPPGNEETHRDREENEPLSPSQEAVEAGVRVVGDLNCPDENCRAQSDENPEDERGEEKRRCPPLGEQM